MLDNEYCPLGVNFWRGQWTIGYCCILLDKARIIVGPVGEREREILHLPGR